MSEEDNQDNFVLAEQNVLADEQLLFLIEIESLRDLEERLERARERLAELAKTM